MLLKDGIQMFFKEKVQNCELSVYYPATRWSMKEINSMAQNLVVARQQTKLLFVVYNLSILVPPLYGNVPWSSAYPNMLPL